MKCPACQAELHSETSFCPYCGQKLDGYGQMLVHHSSHAGAAIGLIMLLVLGGLFVAGQLGPLATQAYNGAQKVVTGVMCFYAPLCPSSGYTTTQGKATYDQQVIMIFAQDFSSLTYNVTAVQQTDSGGYGPAYLLNGHSDSGYWYQVGLAYNWPLASGSGYLSGFHFIYETFDPSGATTNPNLPNTPDNVNANDTVGLSLYFSGGSAVMYAHDFNTGASSSHTLTAAGGSRFVGSSGLSSTRTPTSLMTEWYHPDPSWTTMSQVLYSENTAPISSAQVCIEEYVPPSSSSTVYSGCSSQMFLTNSPQSYSYHGVNTFTSQNLFQSGPSP